MSYPSRFAELDHLLVKNRSWWQFRPFHQRAMPWCDSHPDLVAALLALGDDELSALDASSQALAAWLKPWLPDGDRLLELSRLPDAPLRALDIPARLDVSVPGRKWQQACRFVAARPESSKPLLEWCSGKGHLGRLLASVDNCQVTSLEWQQALCEAGDALSGKLGLAQRFVCGDAFDTSAGDWLPEHGQAVALHACGDLHVTLMRHWAGSAAENLTVSPCCYHLIKDDGYHPMSRQAKASALQLDRADLSLPLQETVTAGRGERRRREQDVLWRLSFDEWQRQVRGVDQYLPVPTLPRRYLSGSFADFCRTVAEHHQFVWPDMGDQSVWLEKGRQRLKLVQRMELVAHLFRRPLEVWLVLDRVLFLEESGARVSLQTFCDRSLTPRNILIHAERVFSAGPKAGH
ncbi:SAM-dependent methyltransferase [Aestuariicella sp. G3-2]|uniref:methyltransferase n=1 Tax=Pseudomaricurvus albidus TaxID=2842452 RepID=UPI001C0E58BC|nr:methyltransferase [Aestuariicella albida]MBU3068296.1 SAM-dependent methyltransferase [Aestuariicella albida]